LFLCSWEVGEWHLRQCQPGWIRVELLLVSAEQNSPGSSVCRMQLPNQIRRLPSPENDSLVARAPIISLQVPCRELSRYLCARKGMAGSQWPNPSKSFSQPEWPPSRDVVHSSMELWLRRPGKAASEPVNLYARHRKFDLAVQGSFTDHSGSGQPQTFASRPIRPSRCEGSTTVIGRASTSAEYETS
jgi:hypothetical protein